MTRTVFLSGSRKISRLNQDMRERLENIVKRQLHVVIGDANGADKAMQSFFAERHYRHVTIYCTGQACRNNAGQWETQTVEPQAKLTGRAFYTLKDKAMAADADCGLVLWDGKSAGSMNNIFEMATKNKPVVVYFSPTQEFCTIRNMTDAKTLAARCTPTDIASPIGTEPPAQQAMFGP